MWVVGGALGVAAAAVLAFTGSQALRRQTGPRDPLSHATAAGYAGW